MANGSHPLIGDHYSGAIVSVIDGIKKKKISTKSGVLIIVAIAATMFVPLVKERMDSAKLVEITPVITQSSINQEEIQNISGNNNTTAGRDLNITNSPDEELVTVGFLNQKIETVNKEISRAEEVLTEKMSGLDEKLTERIAGTKETLSVQMTSEFKRIDENISEVNNKLDKLLSKEGY